MVSGQQRARDEADQQGYEDLQHTYASKSQKHVGDTRRVDTKGDRQLQATNELNDTSSRLKDANAILLQCMSMLKDGEVSMNQRKQMASNVNNLIIPLIDGAAELIKKAAIEVAPRAGCHEYHKMCEGDRKRAAEEKVARGYKRNGRTVEMELIAEFLKRRKPNARKSSSLEPSNNTPRNKKPRTAKVTPPKGAEGEVDDVHIPVPANGHEYTKPEAVRILSETEFNSKERSAMMKKMTGNRWAPTSISTLQRLMAKHKKGELILDDGWSGNGNNGGGRKRAFTNGDIDNLVSQWKRGEAHGEDSVAHAITEARNDLIIRSGGVPLNDNAVSSVCVANVTTRIANHAGVSLVDKATGKTNTRVTAERSKRRLACLLGMVGSTHFFSVPEEDPDIRDALKKLPEKVRVMYDAVTEARGTPVVPVKKHNLWSIDDTTVYTFAGKAPKNDKTKLVTSDSVKASGSESIFQLDDSNSMKGMRVSLTFAFSAEGTTLSIVVCVSGLTEHELRKSAILLSLIIMMCTKLTYILLLYS